MKKTNFKLSNAFYDNRFVLVFSLVCAILVWLVVTLQLSNEKDEVLVGIPVSIDYDSIKDKYDLEPFGTKDFTVNVTVRGKRYIVENAEIAGDIIAKARTSQVTSAGEHTLSIDVESASASADYQIVSVSSDTIDVYFDVMQEKEFEMSIDIGGKYKDNIAPEGYYATPPTMDANSVVKVSGPELQMRKATAVTAFVTIDEQLTDTKVISAAVNIVSSGESNYLRTDLVSNAVDVTFPIYKKVHMPVSVGFTNKPAKYISSNPFDISISPADSDFAIRESKLDGIESVEILTIDFSQLKAGANSFTVTKDGEKFKDMVLMNENTVFTVTVNVPAVSSSSHTVTIGQSSLENIPEGVNIGLVTQSLPVTVVGSQESLAAIQNGDFSVTIDLSGIDTAPANQSVPVQIYLLDSHDCWVYGEYSAQIEVTKAQ